MFGCRLFVWWYWRAGIASRMVMQDRIPYVIPKSCGGRMSCIFLVFIPMIGALSLAGLWMYKTKQVGGVP